MKKLSEIAAGLPGPDPAANQHEIFLLQLDRAELELALSHLGAIYVVEFAREKTPDASVLTDEGVTPLPTWIQQMAAKTIAREMRKFLDARGVEGLRAMANKFNQLLGRPLL